ncbi:MAG: hypothetical protein A3F91_08100 [Flavobacteria bacterium RIFCSPLOWO2_12_FULL_35_11]|nr:MAG: hypothetical protein A3F91_08100 [Flavobacteria bacterium RIFCSPLOWO2_12_FULL_35_11]
MKVMDGSQGLDKKTQAIQRISKNFFFLLIARIIDAGSQLLTISLVSRYLGAARYGDYGYIISFAFLSISFTYLGLERIAIREISKDKTKSGQYLGTCIIVRWAYAVIGWLPMMGVILFLNLPSDIIWGICITNLALNFMGESYIYFALFKAHEKMGYETLAAGVFQLLNIGAILSVKYFNMGFMPLFISLLIANFVRNVLCLIIAWRKFSPPSFRINFYLLKFFVKESYTLGLFILIGQAFVYIDLFILKAFKNTYEVSMFYGPHNFFLLLNIIPASLMASIFPLLSRAASTDTAALTYGFEKSFRILALGALFLVVLFVIFADQFVTILFGKEFQGASRSFQIMAISLVFIIPFHAIEFTMVSINKQNFLFLCPLVGLLLRAILNFILIPKFGFIGASIAAASGYFFLFLTGFFLINGFVGTQPIHKLLLRPIIAAALIALCLYPCNKISMVVMLPLGLIMYTVSLLVTKSLSAGESQFLKVAVKKTGSILCHKISSNRNTMC